MKSDVDILDQLKIGFNFKTDVELAGFLGVTKVAVSQIRHGDMKLSGIQRLRVMDRLESIRVRDLFINIAPEKLAERILELSRRNATKLALAVAEKGISDVSDVVLIDLFKEFGQFRTDKELATYLGFNRGMVSAIRGGTRKLGPLPRLRILRAVEESIGKEVEEIEEIEKGIESSEYLITLIEEHIKIHQSKS